MMPEGDTEAMLDGFVRLAEAIAAYGEPIEEFGLAVAERFAEYGQRAPGGE